MDGALIHHFFVSKEGVFAAAIEETFTPAEMLAPVLDAGVEGMGERLVRTFIDKWEEPTTDQQLLAVLRSAVSNEEAAELLRNFLSQELLGRIVTSLNIDDAELRATLIGAQLVGVAFLRYVLGYGPIAHVETEALVTMLSPTIQRYLTEPLNTADSVASKPEAKARTAARPTKKAVGSGSAPTARDRDGDGRARNARPRDSLGRPLPYGAAGVERLAENPDRTPVESLTEAQRLLDAGRPFEAHEVLEDAWKSSPAAERELWRGMAQLAVGLTHRARGNQAGAVALLTRGAGNLAPFRDAPPHDIDVAGLLAWARQLAGNSAGDADADAEVRPLPRLRTTD